jgi:RNA polymerase sigma factor (sigma-70 family)
MRQQHYEVGTTDKRLTDEQRELAERYIPLTRWFVGKFMPHLRSAADRREWYEILEFALLRAAAGYDPGRGSSFKTFLTHCLFNATAAEVSRRKQGPEHQTNVEWPWQSAGRSPWHRAELADEVARVRSHCHPQRWELVWRYLGLGETYPEIGKAVGLSRERVRQIVDMALAATRRSLGGVARPKQTERVQLRPSQRYGLKKTRKQFLHSRRLEKVARIRDLLAGGGRVPLSEVRAATGMKQGDIRALLKRFRGEFVFGGTPGHYTVRMVEDDAREQERAA